MIEPRTGQEVWSTGVRARHSLHPASYVDGMIFVPADGKITALDAGNGRIVWETPVQDTPVTPIAAGDRLVVASTFGEVSVLDRGTGKVLARESVAHRIEGIPIVMGETMFLIVEDFVEMKTYLVARPIPTTPLPVPHAALLTLLGVAALAAMLRPRRREYMRKRSPARVARGSGWGAP